MCCSPHRFADWAATHYHTRAWQTLIHGKECFILLVTKVCEEKVLSIYNVYGNSKALPYLNVSIILVTLQQTSWLSPCLIKADALTTADRCYIVACDNNAIQKRKDKTLRSIQNQRATLTVTSERAIDRSKQQQLLLNDCIVFRCGMSLMGKHHLLSHNLAKPTKPDLSVQRRSRSAWESTLHCQCLQVVSRSAHYANPKFLNAHPVSA